MIGRLLRAFLDSLGRSRFVRSLVSRLVYPTVAQNLLAEIVPDEASPSGLTEAFSWKTHAYLVLEDYVLD